jgi:hypothetical protein
MSTRPVPLTINSDLSGVNEALQLIHHSPLTIPLVGESWSPYLRYTLLYLGNKPQPHPNICLSQVVKPQ